MAGRSRDGGSVRKLTVCLVYLLTLLGELSVSYVGVPALLSFSLSLLYFFLSCGLSRHHHPSTSSSSSRYNVPLPVSFLRLRRRFPLVPYGGHVTRSTWESFIRAGGNADDPIEGARAAPLSRLS